MFPPCAQLWGQIATHGRGDLKKGVPSPNFIRSFRARHRDITCRNYEKRELAKLKGESFKHLKTFEAALKQVSKANPGIFEKPEFIWNLDETKVSGEHGQNVKVFGSSDTSHGGFRSTNAVAGTGKHLTAVVVSSAAGHVVPPFFILAGVNQMQRWFESLHPEIFKDELGFPHWMTRDNWYPEESCLVPTANRSMKKSILPLSIEHVNVNIRKYVPSSQKVLLTLDGHSSRGG
ncbi:unnamed protein product [Chondrus crispus]|uniref:DDE-1 domain-containing protein n=1 Tax=Chondrus crispus TaxID=2769 RepID=R7Q4J8_CHOCR|nr:unnamed protein product [Chondrus crispus]CDF32934.1 unnamed protein product [Chondrus crispus]|eukprot:XP_005712737.1 unnamed protein product [Chondrus crispus]